jgi:hypothetical protein
MPGKEILESWARMTMSVRSSLLKMTGLASEMD